MAEPVAVNDFEEDERETPEVLTKTPGLAKDEHESHLPHASVLDLDVEAYVTDFNSRIIGAYAAGTGSQTLPADAGVARSLIPPGTAALRDFSYLAPQVQGLRRVRRGLPRSGLRRPPHGEKGRGDARAVPIRVHVLPPGRAHAEGVHQRQGARRHDAGRGIGPPLRRWGRWLGQQGRKNTTLN